MRRAGGAALALLVAVACAGPRTAYVRARTGVFADASASGDPIAWLRCGQHAEVVADEPGVAGALRVRTDGGTEGVIFDRPGVGSFVAIDPAAPVPPERLKRRCALLQQRTGLYAETALGRGTHGESVPASAPSSWLECGELIEIVAVTDPREPMVMRVRTRDGVEGAIFYGTGFGLFAAEFSCLE